MKNKYIIISIVTILILALGVSFAYYSTQIIGEGKRVTLSLKELKVVFTDSAELTASGIIPGEWSDQKSFTVKSQTDDTYYYNIVLENYINTFEIYGYLQYKIEHTSTNGYVTISDDNGWLPLPKAPATRNMLLAYMVPLAAGDTHEYTIRFRYLDAGQVNQAPDMGKTVSGTLGITEGSTPLWASNSNSLKSHILIDNYVNFDNEAPERTGFNTAYSSSTNTFFRTNNAELGETVLYYAGNATNNWVIFGTCKDSTYNCIVGDDLYWRIIRTNEESTGGGIRLLYSGSGSVTDNQGNKIIGITQNGYIGTSNWYSTYNTPYNVGYTKANGTYTSGVTTTDDIRGNDVDSNIKIKVDGFYEVAFLNTDYEDYIDTKAVYCNDRSGDNISSNNWRFGAVVRLNIARNPSYACGASAVGYKTNMTWALTNGNSEEDRYTKDLYKVNDTDTEYFGNGWLDYPIALMTADEIAFAGGKVDTELTSPYAWYYLNASTDSITRENYWWTMSPSTFYSWQFAFMWHVHGSSYTGKLASYTDGKGFVSAVSVVRPVLSLKSDVVWLSGDGTPNNPYQIVVN